MMVQAVLVAALMAGGRPVQVQGPSDCPTAREVAALLPELLPQGEATSPDIAWIEAAGNDLQIELRSAAGEVQFSRKLTSHGTCAELANVAAVVIASWTAERNPDLSLRQPRVPSPPPVPTRVALAQTDPQALAPPSKVRQLDVALGLGGSVNSAGLAGALRLEAGARGRRFGVRVGLSAETARDDAVFAEGRKGSVSWRRYGFSACPTATLVDDIITVDARAELVAGLTTVAGQGLDANRQSSALAPGVGLALRLGTTIGWVRPWLDLGGQYWLADQEIAVTRQPETTRTRLPRIEARIFAGASILLPR